MRKARIGIAGAALLMLAACQNAPSDEPECDCADEVGDGAEGAPDAEPTASIFGPEAEVPEPENAPEAEPLTVTIGFPDGGAQLDADAVAALEAALKSEQVVAGGAITLRAHSDAGGTDTANMDASEERGLAVAAWLIAQGIAEERIEVIAFGEQNPAEPNALPDGMPNEVGRAANRRVELAVGGVQGADAPSTQ